jgi:hypothetical protein
MLTSPFLQITLWKTGELMNRSEVFTGSSKRYELAQKTFDKPVVIVTQAEAEAAEKAFL